MRLTIDTMTYGPDGLARTDEGKAVFPRTAADGLQRSYVPN